MLKPPDDPSKKKKKKEKNSPQEDIWDIWDSLNMGPGGTGTADFIKEAENKVVPADRGLFMR